MITKKHLPEKWAGAFKYFDEIQESPRAIASLKYFCENATEYARVVAGSL